MRPVAHSILVGIAILAGGANPASASAIEWEVRQPFRYFKYRSDFEIHRMAYLALRAEQPATEPSILDVHHKLNNAGWWNAPVASHIARRYGQSDASTPRQILMAMRAEEIARDGRYPGYPEFVEKIATVLPLLSVDLRRLIASEYDFRRLGWASLLFPAHQQTEDIGKGDLIAAQNVAVCWNRAAQRHNNCPDYLVPKVHAVELRIAEDRRAAVASQTCTWRLDTASGARFVGVSDGASAEVRCDGAVTARIPFEKAVRIAVNTVGLSESEDVQVRDLLIVGLGDSFSSGEGNPDVPAKMRWTSSRSQDPFVLPNGLGAAEPGYVPLRKNDGDYFAAQWIDRACHRSAYSFPVQMSIQLAIADPHRAVTLLSYACSGAEINEGLFNPFMGPERVDNKEEMQPFEQAQLSLLLKELCNNYRGVGMRGGPIAESEEDALIAAGRYTFGSGRAAADGPFRCADAPLGEGFKRPIDALLLSIGGNDAGFARWITAAIAPLGSWGVAKAFLPILGEDAADKAVCKEHSRSCKTMRQRWKWLDARYAILREFLDRRLTFRGSGPKPIFVYSYPVATKDVAGSDCRSGNSGMTVFGLKDICLRALQGTVNPLRYVANFGNFRLNPRVATFARGPDPAQRWTLVDDYVREFDRRSFCATKVNETNPEAPPEPQDKCYSLSELRLLHKRKRIPKFSTASGVNETLHVPRFLDEWRPFDPVLGFQPYAPRQRWSRTMNDAYILINQQKAATRMNPDQRLLSFTQSAIFGAFHPTAEGHARISDSFLRAINAKLTAP